MPRKSSAGSFSSPGQSRPASARLSAASGAAAGAR